MTPDKLLALGQTALELGLVNALTVLALFLSYSMLNVCDLSTDGCFTLGAAVGALVAISGHPWLALPAAMLAGSVSGFITATLQMRMGVQSLLAGIVVNTGLYSLNMALTGNKATQKRYYRHSGYPGGLKSESFEELIKKHPERVIEHAVKGMLPKNTLGRAQGMKLKVYAGPDHPHAAQKPRKIEL